MIEQQIDQDLKQAMLDRDSELVSALRNLKSSLLYYKISINARNETLKDQAVIELLVKEAKKRQESADLFKAGGNLLKSTQELNEKKIIQKYLPEMMSREEIVKLVDDEIVLVGKDKSKMGLIINAVRQKTNGLAEGATLAEIVKERLT